MTTRSFTRLVLSGSLAVLAMLIAVQGIPEAAPPTPTFTTIDFPGAAQTFPLEINERGEIVGAYLDPDGTQHGYSFGRGGFATIDFRLS